MSVDLAGDLLGFLDDAVDRRAIDRLGLGAVHLEHLLQPLHVVLGLVEMGLEALLELRVGRLLDHLRQRFHDLLLGVVDVLQLMHEQVVHGLDVFGKQSHCGHPCVLGTCRRRPFFGRTHAVSLDAGRS